MILMMIMMVFLDTDEESKLSWVLDYDFYDGTPSGYTVDNIPTWGISFRNSK